MVRGGEQTYRNCTKGRVVQKEMFLPKEEEIPAGQKVYTPEASNPSERA